MRLILLIGFSCVPSLVAQTEFLAGTGEQFLPDQLIVRLQPGANIGQLISGVTPQAVPNLLSSNLNIYLFKLPAGTQAAVSKLLASSPLVQFVEPNRLRKPIVTPPNDPKIIQQWDLTTLQAVQAWSYIPDQYLTAASAGNGSNRVKVALIDTGVDCTHPDFMNAGGTSTDSAQGGQLSWTLSQAIEPTTIPSPACPWEDFYGHGTHTAGTIAAATNNATGVASVGFPLEIIAYQVFQNVSGQILASDSDIATAIDDAVSAGAKVISMSIGGPGYSQSMQSAMDLAWEHNVLVVAAAGNAGNSALQYPGGGNHVLGVTATDSNNNIASFSTYGNWIKIAGPGVNILSTLPTYSNSFGTNYGVLSGTSMATPHVAAVAGLLYMLYPNLSVAEIAQRLQQTALTPNSGWNQYIGYGVVSAGGALSGTVSPATQGSLVGQVVNTSGSPITGAQVSAGGLSMTTANDSASGDADGLFRLANLNPGTYTLTVTASGFSTATMQAAVVAGADTMLTVTMGVTSGEFKGLVTYNGVAVPGAAVEAVSGAGLVLGTAVTDATGSYAVYVKSGNYTLTASAPNYINFTSPTTFVGSGGTSTVNLPLSASGTLIGTVTDANGLPVANAHIDFTASGFSGGTSTGSNGAYSTFGIPSGIYTVTASAPGYGNVSSSGAGVTANTSTLVNLQFSTGVSLGSGLLGYWPFDEDAGNVAHDASGNGHNANLTNTTWNTGIFNFALGFNGSNSLALTSAIPFINAFSISAWVNPAVTSQASYARIAETQVSSGLYLGVESTGTMYQFVVNGGTGATGTCGVQYGCAEGGSVTAGWHLVSGTYDGTTTILYVDGAMVASDTAQAPSNASLPLYIGQAAVSGSVWNGLVDDLRLYSRALTASEISTLFHQAYVPNLALTKTADAAAVSAGASIGYTLGVNNGGGGTATGVVLSDPLPAVTGGGWSIAAGNSGTCSITGQTLNCNFGTLGPAATASVHVTSATTAASCAAYPNTATLTADNNSQVQSSATITVQCPNLALTKAADASTVSAGAQIGYTLTVTNNGSGTATTVNLTDTLPTVTGGGWSIVAGNSGTCSITGQTLNCNFGTLGPSAIASVHVTSATTASSCAAYPNTATLTAGNNSQVQSSATVTVQCPSLALTKAADAVTVSAGTSIGYTLTATNNGSGTATTVNLTDTLPTVTGGGWSIVAGNSGTCSITGQTLNCNFGTLGPSAIASVHVTSATTTASCAAYPNTATLTAGNNSQVQSSATVTVQCPSLALTKAADAVTVSAGTSIGYTLTATNNGSGTATTVNLTDTLPTVTGGGWSIVAGNSGTCSITGQTLNCSFGTLGPSATASVHVTSATTTASCAAYPNTATLTADNNSQVQSSATTTVQCPNLALSKAADASTVSAGTSIGYTLTATNNGSGTATTVNLTDTLPTVTGGGWSIVAGNSGTCSITGQTLNCNFGTLGPSATASVHVTSATTTASCAAYPNTATLTAGNNSQVQSSATVTVQCPSLALTKAADAVTVSAGTSIGYTLTATNNGSGTATTVNLTDTLPTVTGGGWSIVAGNSGTCSITGQTLNCNFGTLGPSATASVHVISATTTASCAAYPNTATLTAGNNSQVQSSATVTVQCPSLALAKAADNTTVSAGAQIGYKMTATNNGSGTATTVALTDTLPTVTGGGWTIAAGNSGTCSITGQTLNCNFGTLGPSATASVHVTSATTSASCAAYPNTATLTAGNNSQVQSSATATVQCPSLALAKAADNTTVSAGAQIGYKMTAANNGSGSATTVNLSDTLPTVTGGGWTIAAGNSGTCSITGQTLNCNFGTLGPSATASVHVTSATTSASCAAYPNTATLTADNNSQVQSSTTITVQCPNLALTKAADASTVSAGTSIGYTLAATNNGSGKATTVALADTLPTVTGGGWSIVAGNSGTCTITGQTLSCNFGTLGPSATASVHVTSATTTASCAAYPNTATLTAGNNNQVQSSATITVQCPNLALSEAAGNATVSAGAQIGYKITATNNGSGAASTVVLNDTLPTVTGGGWSITPGNSGTCSIAGQTLNCSFGTLAPSASASVYVTSATTSASCAAYPNTATLTADNSSQVQSSATTTVQCPNLALTKTADASTASAGSQIGYTLTAANNGSGTATTVVLNDTLPTVTGGLWTIAGGNSGTCSITGQTLNCNFGTLAQGATASVHVTSATTAATCAAYPNTATLTADNSSQVQSSATITVQCPSLALAAAADNAAVPAGSQIGYTLTASNAGAGTAAAVMLSDPLPAATGVSWSISPAQGSCSINNQVLSCNFGSLGPSAAASVHVISSTSLSSCGAYSNSATLSANNSTSAPASATITVLCPTLTVNKSHLGSFGQSQSGVTYSVTVSNGNPAAPTSGGVTVTETVPPGLTLLSMAGAGWTCTAGGNTCSRNDALNPNSSYSPIIVTVNVAANAASPQINAVTVSGGGSAMAGAADPATIVPYTCDINGDGTVNVTDVQTLVNEALGVIAASHDLNHDGLVNVADVQKLINAALGLGCPY